MPTINAKQIVLIIIAMLSFVAGASAQLSDLFGAGMAKAIVSSAVFINGLMSAAMTPFLSNTNVVKDAGSLDGVAVRVSRDAPQPIAALAMSPDNNGVSPARGEEIAVQQKAVVTP